MRSARRAVAVTCIALVVVAAVLSFTGASLEWLEVTPDFTLLPACNIGAVPSEARHCDERLVALLAILESRGPPFHPSPA
jgi:hypothetical protein